LRFFDSAFIILATNVLSLIAALVSNILISRALGDTGKGLIAMFLYLPSVLFAVSNLGMGFTAQYFISRDDGAPHAHLTNILFFPMVMAGLIVASFCLTFDVWRPYLHNLSLQELIPALCMLPLMIIYEPCCQLLIAFGRAERRSIAVFLQSYVSLVAIGLLLLIPGASAGRVMWGYICGSVIAIIFCLYFNVQRTGLPSLPSWGLFRRTLKYGFWIYAGNLVGQVFQRVDFFFVWAVRGVAEGGVYSVAIGMTSPLLIIPQAVHTVFFPRTSSQSDADAKERTPVLYRQIIIVMCGAAVGVAALSRPVLYLFGERFVAGQIPLLILLVAIILKGMNGILSLHILGRGKAYTMTITTFAALIVAIAMSYLLVPSFGMTGAALATTLAYAAENLILTFLFGFLVGGEIRSLYSFKRKDFSVLIGESLGFLSRMRERYR
jgi:O-antigen/teichoic acid export membrane protein